MKIRKILQALNRADMALAELFGDAFSRKTAWRDILSPEYGPHQSNYKNEEDEWRKEKAKFLKLMNYLVKQGLVYKKANNIWKINQKGKEYFKRLINLNPPAIRIPKSELKVDKLKVIIFDIPEKDKKRRAWIRQSLKNMDFEMFQKSVWIGESKLPREFFERLAEFKLIDCVHVFEVTKTGTMDYGLKLKR